MYAGPVLYDIDDTAEVMRWYREFAAGPAGGPQRLDRP